MKIDKWSEKYDRLVKYKEKYNTTCVPKRYKNDPKLGQWVCYQRTSYHTKNSSLTVDRITKLDSIGFVWKITKTNPGVAGTYDWIRKCALSELAIKFFMAYEYDRGSVETVLQMTPNTLIQQYRDYRKDHYNTDTIRKSAANLLRIWKKKIRNATVETNGNGNTVGNNNNNQSIGNGSDERASTVAGGARDAPASSLAFR